VRVSVLICAPECVWVCVCVCVCVCVLVGGCKRACVSKLGPVVIARRCRLVLNVSWRQGSSACVRGIEGIGRRCRRSYVSQEREWLAVGVAYVSREWFAGVELRTGGGCPAAGIPRYEYLEGVSVLAVRPDSPALGAGLLVCLSPFTQRCLIV